MLKNLVLWIHENKLFLAWLFFNILCIMLPDCVVCICLQLTSLSCKCKVVYTFTPSCRISDQQKYFSGQFLEENKKIPVESKEIF